MRALMCQPDFFHIDEEINVWMSKRRQPRSEKARMQWQELMRIYAELRVELWFIEPQPGLQDMCFTANAGWCRWGKMILANFRHAIRKAEEPYYELWFGKYRSRLLNVEVVKLPPHIYFEGQGDVVTAGSEKEAVVLVGYGQNRTDYEAARYLGEIHGLSQDRVIPVRLINPQFYHLDTACLFIPPRFLLYYPDAFDSASKKVLAGLPVELLPVGEEDAKRFACNGVFVEHGGHTTVIMNKPSKELVGTLDKFGFLVRGIDMSEFLKSGGSARCLTLFLPDES